MHLFLHQTISKLLAKGLVTPDTVIVLPSKRSVGFFKKILAEQSSKSYFAPHILSIEEFIIEISGLSFISQTELLVRGYQIYIQEVKGETFDEYLDWAPTLFNDFNEIDRHLVDPKSFFSYLSSIKTLEKWGIKNQETPFIKNYLKFWGALFPFYESLQESLLSEQKGYQGMVYRKAAEDIEHYIHHAQDSPHIFIGFNALNKAEETIFQELLEHGNTEVYWDIDHYFAEDINHSVSFFYRKYIQDWKYYQIDGAPSLSSFFETKKEISIIQTQGDVEQVKYVGTYLKQCTEAEINKTAIVLADENLLIPLVYSLPNEIPKANVTMGFPLKNTPTGLFFRDLIRFQEKSGSLYYKRVQKILQHPTAQLLVKDSQAILLKIAQYNLSYFSLNQLLDLSAAQNHEVLELMFGNWNEDANKAIHTLDCILKALLNETLKPIERISLSSIDKILKETHRSLHAYQLSDFSVFKNLFEELIDRESLDFEGDAHQGLQIMGMLETRVLDFEHIIMLSVNEGVLPSGKTQSSYITHDLKKQYGLPSYSEKDAVYAYHFFRLMQRVKKATFLYNNTSQGLQSGEKSRFLRQLELINLPKHKINFEKVTQKMVPVDKGLSSIHKTPEITQRVIEIAEQGFSPSALSSYIRNPIDFYQQRILRIKEIEEVEETVAYNTLGTIVHEVLEIIYEPFVNQVLNIQALTSSLKSIDGLVAKKFQEHYKLGDTSKGKNLIIFEVAKQYVTNLLNLDIQLLKEGNEIEILKLEQQLKVPLTIHGLSFPIFLKGTVDRMDRLNGKLRVIDYKTGKVSQGDLEIVDWDLLVSEEKFSKAFQVLCYAYMQLYENPTNTIEAGVISFKNLRNGFLQFAKKPAPRSTKKEYAITSEVLEHFKIQLHNLILEICNPDIPFLEKEIKKAGS